MMEAINRTKLAIATYREKQRTSRLARAKADQAMREADDEPARLELKVSD